MTSKFGSATVAPIWYLPAGELSSATQEYSTFTPEVSAELFRLEVKAGFISPSKRSTSSTFTLSFAGEILNLREAAPIYPLLRSVATARYVPASVGASLDE